MKDFCIYDSWVSSGHSFNGNKAMDVPNACHLSYRYIFSWIGSNGSSPSEIMKSWAEDCSVLLNCCNNQAVVTHVSSKPRHQKLCDNWVLTVWLQLTWWWTDSKGWRINQDFLAVFFDAFSVFVKSSGNGTGKRRAANGQTENGERRPTKDAPTQRPIYWPSICTSPSTSQSIRVYKPHYIAPSKEPTKCTLTWRSAPWWSTCTAPTSKNLKT
jgi:hypothetical protein